MSGENLPAGASLSAASSRRGRWVVILCIAMTLVLSGLLLTHASGMNGPRYFQWPWKHMSLTRTACVMAIVSVHAAVLVWINIRKMPFWLPLVFLTLCASWTQLGIAVMSAIKDPLDYAREAVCHPGTGSFVTVALALNAMDWRMEDYPEMTRVFPSHAMNKPPGPTLFWLAMFQMITDQTRALNVGLIVVSLLGAGSGALATVWARQLGATRQAALHVGSVLSLLPGTLVFFPLFDATYAMIAMILIVSWTQVLIGRSPWWSVVFGILLAASLVCCFQILPIGWLLVSEALVVGDGDTRARLQRFLRRSILSIATCVLTLLLLKSLAGYDVVHMFRAAIENQSALMAKYGNDQRPYPLTIPWDLYDFALGAGYLVVIVVAASLLTRPDPHLHSDSPMTRAAKWVSWSGIALLVLIATTGALPGETARVWNFLYPTLALPAGLFLAGLPGRVRLTLLGCQVVMLTVMVHSMTFVSVEYR